MVLFSLLIHENTKYYCIYSYHLLFFLFVLYNFSSEEIQYIIIDTIKFENTSSLGHLIEWIEGILSILENPLGIGLAMSGNAGGVDQSLKVGGENQFLILGVQMGAIALFVYTLILFYVIIRAIKTFQNSKNHQKHISYVVACSKFGLLLPLLTANAELYLFVSLTTWFLAGNVESTYIKQLVEKKRVYIDVFYYKTALSGLKTYIEELVSASKTHGDDQIEYIFSHDIKKIINNHVFINSKFRIIRWIFQLRYLVWKQIILPIKLLINKVDIVICPDYVAPIICYSKKIVVIHDNLFWKYPKNYPRIWRNYFTKLIQLGLNSKSIIITTSNYSKLGLQPLFKKIKFIRSTRVQKIFQFNKLMKMVKNIFYMLEHLKGEKVY